MEEELDRDDPGIPEPQVKKHGLLLQNFRQSHLETSFPLKLFGWEFLEKFLSR